MLEKYLKIYKVFLANSFSYEAQYRQDTWIKLATNLLWVGMLFIIIEVIFSQTKTIVGWSKEQIYLMTVLWIMAGELYDTFFANNLPFLSDAVVNGDLDFYLTKPVSALFLASCMKIHTRGFYKFLAQAGILLWLVWHFNFAPSAVYIAGGILLFSCSLLISYSLSLMTNTLSFWFLRIDNINTLVGALQSIGRYPLGIWPKTIKIIFLSAIPVAFSAYIPVAALTGRLAWYGIVYALVFSALIFFMAVKFWNFALSRYSSASS